MHHFYGNWIAYNLLEHILCYIEYFTQCCSNYFRLGQQQKEFLYACSCPTTTGEQCTALAAVYLKRGYLVCGVPEDVARV